MKALPFLFVTFVALAACQTYDFEPVPIFTATQHTAELEMKASPLPPNIMILIDKSDSMNTMVGPAETEVGGGHNAACKNCVNVQPNNPCPPTCATRINELRYAMQEFLEESHHISDSDPRPLGKFGLTLFPNSKDQCAASENVQVAFTTSDDDEALRGKITEVQKYIFEELYNTPTRKPIYGGTPTGNSLRYLLNHVPELEDEYRKSFILLLTDGLPNCNSNIEEGGCPDRNNCLCTLAGIGVAGMCVEKDYMCQGGIGCLDNHATVKIIGELNEKKIGTIVIGFGVDSVAGINTEAVLNAMASAGGVSPTYFPAQDRASLLKVLRELRDVFEEQPCAFKLSGEVSDPALISVYVDDKRIIPGNDTYYYENNHVIFHEDGVICPLLKNSSNKDPVSLRISILQTL